MAKSSTNKGTAAKKATEKETKSASKSKTKANKETEKIVEEIIEKPVVENTEKDEIELTIKGNLATLYRLQKIDSKIDKIRIIKGELPLEVQDLEDEVEGLGTRIENYIQEIDEIENSIKVKKSDSKDRLALLKRYEEQLNNVRNNREYDALQKEVEFQGLEIQLNEKHIKEFETRIANLNESIKLYQTELGGLQSELEIKQSELKEIAAETEIEEKELQEKSIESKKKIEERLLFAYSRIRKAARNGLAVVAVERNSCGGCFSSIPPQKQIDIKSHKKIIVCEFCGRILIDEELINEIGA